MISHKMFNRLLRSFLAMLVLSCAVALWGQAVNGTLLGTVTDSTGAAVANAHVTATNVATSAKFESATNGSGNYTFPGLQPGNYTVAINASGFKKAQQENIPLLANTTIRIDIALLPGSVSETVTVTTAPPVLQTDRADISTKLEAVAVAELPLTTNRNFQSLLNLVPGTAPAVFQHSQFFNAADTLQTEANGMPREGNLYQIEGIDDDERTGLLQILIPPADAIQSVDISTNNFEAELGRATGAVTNVTLKSGQNAFHGSVFEFIQNNYTNARPYFSTIPLGHLAYNYFGGSIGGRIIKDKLFFFGDFLRTVDSEAITGTFTVPDSRFYTNAGVTTGCSDAKGCIDLSGVKGTVYDPATGDGKNTHRTLFTNNQIPISRVNSISLAILQGVNTAAAKYGKFAAVPLASFANNYSTNLPFSKKSNSYDGKIDFTPSEKNHLSGRYSYQHTLTFQAPAFGAFWGGPMGGGFQATGTQNSYSTGINYDHIFTPSFFTELRLGVAHLRNFATPSDYGQNDASTLGVAGVNLASDPFTSGQVGVSFNDTISGPMIGYVNSLPWIRGEANIDIVNNWSKIVGNHTFKWGADLRRVRDDLLQDQTFSPRGAFTFSEGQTLDSNGTSGLANEIASFLFDLPSQVGRDLDTYFPCYRQWWFFAFGGDKWQATPKLTIDYGIRWEFYPPATPRKAGAFSNYNPTNNTLVLAGVGGNPLNLGMTTQYRYFAPRTGLSYRVSNDTVVRAGFGISYMPFPDNTYAYNYPVRANNSYQPTGSASAYTPAVLGDGVTTATFQAGFPAPVAITIPSNGLIAASTSQLISQVYTYIPLNYKNPYAMSWNFVVQQAFKGNYSLQIAYVANHGVDISGSQNINLPSTWGGGAASDPENTTAFTGGSTGRTAATNQYFVGFSSNYQSLQTQLTKRLSGGLAFTSAFTWGKELNYISGDDGGLTFFINWRRNYAPADYDRTRNFEQTFTWELPAGRGHKYFNTGLANYALGGWKLTGTFSAVSGQPFTVTASGTTLNTPGTSQTASINGGLKVLHNIGSGKQWFDTTNFSQPTGCTGQTTCTAPGLGNTGRNQFRGPGYIQDNISVSKRFPIYREMNLETRLDVVQLTNTPQFANPTSSLTSSSFGQITSTLGSGQGTVNGVGGGRSLQGSVRISF
ncbi:MAG: carboxypeptidase regulatory-like domain-containing protein [Terracidiphilus sp.]|nr:carboxypeptidase regulatory-like domain-containing protein [Terracidiphilus sp.]